jgi:hypothetical protein
MNILTNLFGRLAAAHRRARQQRELLLQQKRERFLTVHNSDTAPPELLIPPPRRLHRHTAFAVIWVSLALLYGVVFLGKTVIPAFKTLEARELEMRNWVQRRTAKPPVNERDARNQKLAREAGELDAESVQALRRIMVLAAILLAAQLIVLPSLLMWLLLRILGQLRNGIVTRAELASRKPWGGSARVSFTTADGKPVETVQTIPVYVPIGAKLWILYSPRCPKRTLVYRPDSALAKLLRNAKSCNPSSR